MPRRGRGHQGRPPSPGGEGELVDLSDKRAGIVINSLDPSTQHKLLCRQLCNERQELRKTTVRILTDGFLDESDVPTLLNGAIELVPLLPSPLVLEALREQVEMANAMESMAEPAARKEVGGAKKNEKKDKPSLTTGAASSFPEAAAKGGPPTTGGSTATGSPPEGEGNEKKDSPPPRRHLRRSSDERIEIREARRQHVLLNENFFKTIPDMELSKFELLLREARPISPLTRFGHNPAPELLLLQSEPALGVVLKPQRGGVGTRTPPVNDNTRGDGGGYGARKPPGPSSSFPLSVEPSGGSGGGHGPKPKGTPVPSKAAGPPSAPAVMTPRRRRQQQLMAMAESHRDEEDSPERNRHFLTNARGTNNNNNTNGGAGHPTRKVAPKGKRLAAHRERLDFAGRDVRAVAAGGEEGKKCSGSAGEEDPSSSVPGAHLHLLPLHATAGEGSSTPLSGSQPPPPPSDPHAAYFQSVKEKVPFGQQNTNEKVGKRMAAVPKNNTTTTTTTTGTAPGSNRMVNLPGPISSFVFPPPEEDLLDAEVDGEKEGGPSPAPSRATQDPLQPVPTTTSSSSSAPDPHRTPAKTEKEVLEEEEEEGEEEDKEEEDEEEEGEEVVVLVNSNMNFALDLLEKQKHQKEAAPLPSGEGRRKHSSGLRPHQDQQNPHLSSASLPLHEVNPLDAMHAFRVSRAEKGSGEAGDEGEDNEFPSLGDLQNDIPEVLDLAVSVNDLVAAAAAEEKTVGASSGGMHDLDSVIQRAASVRGTTKSMGPEKGGGFVTSSINFAASSSFFSLVGSPPPFSKSVAFASRVPGASPAAGMDEFSEEDSSDPKRFSLASILNGIWCPPDVYTPEEETEAQKRRKNANRRLPPTPVPPPTVTEALHLPLPSEALDIELIFGGSQSFSSEYMYGTPQTYRTRPPMMENVLMDLHEFSDAEEEDFVVLDDGRKSAKSGSQRNAVYKDRFRHHPPSTTSRSHPSLSSLFSTDTSTSSRVSSHRRPSRRGVEVEPPAAAAHSPHPTPRKSRTHSTQDAPSTARKAEEGKKKKEENENEESAKRRDSRPLFQSVPHTSLSTTVEPVVKGKTSASSSPAPPLLPSSPKKSGARGGAGAVPPTTPSTQEKPPSAPPALAIAPLVSGGTSPRHLSTAHPLSNRSSTQTTPRDTPAMTPDSLRTTPHTTPLRTTAAATTTNSSTSNSASSSSVHLGKPPMGMMHDEKKNSRISRPITPVFEKIVSTPGNATFPYYKRSERDVPNSGSTRSLRAGEEDVHLTHQKPPIPKPQIRLSQIRRPTGSSSLDSAWPSSE